jgi:hypothetical protein
MSNEFVYLMHFCFTVKFCLGSGFNSVYDVTGV